MVLKHNFSMLNNADINPLWGAMLEINESLDGFFAILLLAVLFLIFFYVMNKRTQDITKSGISSFHIITILTIILYYAGKTDGVTGDFISDFFILSVVIIEAILIALIYYTEYATND